VKFGQLRKLRRNRIGPLTLRKVSPLAVVFLLGACSTSLQDCLDRNESRQSTRGIAGQLPQGCLAREAGTRGLTILDCKDGREGFMFRGELIE
jgi:hypothetical protein